MADLEDRLDMPRRDRHGIGRVGDLRDEAAVLAQRHRQPRRAPEGRRSRIARRMRLVARPRDRSVRRRPRLRLMRRRPPGSRDRRLDRGPARPAPPRGRAGRGRAGAGTQRRIGGHVAAQADRAPLASPCRTPSRAISRSTAGWRGSCERRHGRRVARRRHDVLRQVVAADREEVGVGIRSIGERRPPAPRP